MNPINLKTLAAAILVSFAGYPAATAQNTGTNGSLKQAELPRPVPLNVLWRVVVNGVDRMTSVGAEERNAFPLEGQMFYIAADLGEPGSTPFNRFNNGPDHRDSTSNALPGYVLEGPNGAAWTRRSALLGLGPILEGFNGTTGDYALIRFGEDLPGYKTHALQAYGFQRFGNDTESLLSLTKGGVTVESNRVYGGSLWHWKWNGVEFLNPAPTITGAHSLLLFDVGDGFRTAFEGGDYFAHGAPVVDAKNEGKTQTTRALPLVDDPALVGVDRDHAVVWKNMVFGKELTLNFDGMGSVAKYSTQLGLPSPIDAASLYHPQLNFRAEFSRFWIYHAASDVLQEVTPMVPDACVDNTNYVVNLDVGGIIVSEGSTTHAIGAYGADLANGGSITDYVLWKYGCAGGSVTDFTRLDIVRNAPLPAGNSTYNVYLITETLDNVRQKMRQLFLAGVR